jgi:hypothetical protein
MKSNFLTIFFDNTKRAIISMLKKLFLQQWRAVWQTAKREKITTLILLSF